MSNVIKLAVDNARVNPKPCSTCVHYHPATSDFGVIGWKFLWWGPGRRPSSNAIQFAQCSAAGGMYAKLERSNCRGNWWEADHA